MIAQAVSCPVLVGRDEVLAELLAAQQRAHRSAVTIFLEGPAGTGKSRLLTEAMRTAVDAGFTVLLGECRDAADKGFEPFTSAMARHERTLLSEETQQLFGGRGRFARVLVPHLVTDETGSTQAPTPAHLHAAVVEVVARLTAHRPLMLAFEDLHWAGRDALTLLGALIRETSKMPLMILATYRPGEAAAPDALAEIVSRVHRTRSGERVELDPLGGEDVALMLRAMFPEVTFSDEFISSLRDRTQGNPFFVEEICRTLVQENKIPSMGEAFIELPLDVIPEAILSSVLTRLRAASETTQRLLEIAAIAGEVIDRRLLAEASGLDERAVDVAMDEAIEVGAVAERFDGPVSYLAFAHALTRDALVSSMSRGARRDAHKRLGDAQVGLHPHDLERVAGEIADHLAAAGDAEGAFKHAVSAARYAARRGASSEAVHRYGQCLELAASDDARLPIAIEASQLHPWLDPERAKRLADRAGSLAHRLGHPDREAEALVVSARAAWLLGSADAPAIFEDALDLVEGRGDAAELSVLVEMAWHFSRSGWRDHAQRAQQLVERATPLAAAYGDPFVRGRLEIANARSAKFNLDSIAAACARARRLFAEAGNVYEQAGCDAVEGNWALLHEGDFRHARRCLRRYEEAMDELSPRRPSIPFSASILAAIWLGDFVTARAMLESPTWEDSPLSEASRIEALIEIELRAGDPKVALSLARRGWTLIKDQRELDWLLPMLAGLAKATLRVDGFDDARPWFEQALDNAGQGHGAYHWYFSPDYARALFDSSLNDELLSLRKRLEEITVACGEQRHDLAALSYVRGLIAMLAAEFDGGREELQGARRLWDAMPYPARSCEALLAAAELERRAGDRTSSAEHAAHALDIAQEIASPPLIAEARAALERLGRPGRRSGAALAGPGSLTPREREIVRLTVAGLTAQQVAERLVVSRRTVEGHLTRARDKLGAASKADLVRKAVKLDL